MVLNPGSIQADSRRLQTVAMAAQRLQEAGEYDNVQAVLAAGQNADAVMPEAAGAAVPPPVPGAAAAAVAANAAAPQPRRRVRAAAAQEQPAAQGPTRRRHGEAAAALDLRAAQREHRRQLSPRKEKPVRSSRSHVISLIVSFTCQQRWDGRRGGEQRWDGRGGGGGPGPGGRQRQRQPAGLRGLRPTEVYSLQVQHSGLMPTVLHFPRLDPCNVCAQSIPQKAPRRACLPSTSTTGNKIFLAGQSKSKWTAGHNQWAGAAKGEGQSPACHLTASQPAARWGGKA